MTESINLIGKIRKTQKKGTVRRQQIIDTARQILIKDGVNGLVLRDIAVRLNITHGNVQYYFPTKDDLLVAVFDGELARYITALQVTSNKTLTRKEHFDEIINSAIKEIEGESTVLWLMLISLSGQNKKLAAILGRANHLYDEALKKRLGHISPNMPGTQIKHIAQMIRMMIDGLSIEMTCANPKSPEMLSLYNAMRATVASWLGEGASSASLEESISLKAGAWVLSLKVSPVDDTSSVRSVRVPLRQSIGSSQKDNIRYKTAQLDTPQHKFTP